MLAWEWQPLQEEGAFLKIPPVWQLLQSTLACAPVRENPVLKWSNGARGVALVSLAAYAGLWLKNRQLMSINITSMMFVLPAQLIVGAPFMRACCIKGVVIN